MVSWHWLRLAARSQMCSDQWSHVGSLKLAMVGALPPHKLAFAIYQGLCFPPESWFASTPRLVSSRFILSFVYSLNLYFLSIKSIWHCSVSLPSSTTLPFYPGENPPHLSSNLSWKRMIISPFRAFFFHISLALDTFFCYITLQYVIFSSIINWHIPPCPGGYQIIF